MSSPYTSVAIAGYNASPPDDDGSEIQSNQVEWAKHLDKIGDPIKDAVESIDTNTQAAFTAIYGQTQAEADALVTPLNWNVPNHNSVGDILVARYMTVGATEIAQAWIDAIAVADQLTGGKVQLPPGDFTTNARVSCNQSNTRNVGAGSDATVITPTGSFKTAFEINNGSWDDSSEVYTLSGTSIGSSTLESMTLNGDAATSATGVVFARATRHCKWDDVKIVGNFAVAARFYGAWYSKILNSSVTPDNRGIIVDYETNTFVVRDSDFTTDPADQCDTYFEFPGAGTCRSVTFDGCSFDGLPTSYGARFHNVQQLNFVNCYTEVYAAHPTLDKNMFEFKTVTGCTINGAILIAGALYTGTFFKLGTDGSNRGNGVSIMGMFQYNAASNSCKAVDTTFAVGVRFIGGCRFENGITITDVAEVEPAYEVQTFIPATTGTDEIIHPICNIKGAYVIPVTRIRLHCVESGTTTATQYFRVRNKADDTLYINFPMPTTITEGDVFDLTDQSGDGYVTSTGQPAIQSIKARDVVLEAYTYKVGGSKDWPSFMVSVELL